MRGCLPLLVVFVAALVLERQLVADLGLPFPDVVAAPLATAATLTVSTLQGIQQARQQRATPQQPRATWTDGALVRVEGTLAVIGAPVKAPFSERAAAFLDYDGSAPMLGDVGDTRQRPHWRGLVAVDCALDLGGERVPLRGMPATREWREDRFRDEPYVSRAAHHLATTTWTRQPHLLSFDAAAAIGELTASADARAGFSMHLMNREAAEAVGMVDGSAREADLASRLHERPWLFTERLVEPGALVTVTGTWHASANSLDIALSPARRARTAHRGCGSAGYAPMADAPGACGHHRAGDGGRARRRPRQRGGDLSLGHQLVRGGPVATARERPRGGPSTRAAATGSRPTRR